jgi:serine/threonine-protein phosphatase CPPED1
MPSCRCKQVLEVFVRSKYVFLLAIFVVFIVPSFGQEQSLYFMMLTDTQMGMYASDKDFVRETANYEFAVATVNRLKPAFVILLGDLVNKEGNADELREFKRITAKIDSSIPVYCVAGNHDIGHQPTPESLAAYRQNIGRDYYSFRAGPIYGIVLNSTLIHAPQKAEAENQAQISWLKAELEKAKASDAKHIVVFQHHLYFVNDPKEPDQFGNIALERRQPMLALLHQYNVHYVFAGHIHRNSVGMDSDLEMTATGPIAMPFGEEGSGIRLAEVTAAGIKHRYYSFGKMPDGLAIK